MIKAYSVRYEEKDKKTIESRLKPDTELLIRRNRPNPAEEPKDGFVEGIKAVVVEAVPSEEEISQKTAEILEDAGRKAQSILDKAKQEAEQLKAEALKSANKKGYEEGLQQGLNEVQKKAAELENIKKKQQEEYASLVAGVEPEMVEIMAGLIEKVTGVLVEDKKEVLLYLTERAFRKLDRADKLSIRVSREDYEYIYGKKEYLIGAAGREIELQISEDPNLLKNQCLIETDTKVIDCSLDVQLKNLITDLRLLCGI